MSCSKWVSLHNHKPTRHGRRSFKRGDRRRMKNWSECTKQAYSHPKLGSRNPTDKKQQRVKHWHWGSKLAYWMGMETFMIPFFVRWSIVECSLLCTRWYEWTEENEILLLAWLVCIGQIPFATRDSTAAAAASSFSSKGHVVREQGGPH